MNFDKVVFIKLFVDEFDFFLLSTLVVLGPKEEIIRYLLLSLAFWSLIRFATNPKVTKLIWYIEIWTQSELILGYYILFIPTLLFTRVHRHHGSFTLFWSEAEWLDQVLSYPAVSIQFERAKDCLDILANFDTVFDSCALNASDFVH